MRFVTKLALAMLVVAVLASAVGLVASMREVRRESTQALLERFRSGFAAAMSLQDASLKPLARRCQELSRSPRIIAALQGPDTDSLSKITFDELKTFFREFGGRADFNAYLFLDAEGKVLEPGTGIKGVDEAIATWAKADGGDRANGGGEGGGRASGGGRAGGGSERSSRESGYLVIAGAPYLTLATRVDDLGEQIATLVVLVPCSLPPSTDSSFGAIALGSEVFSGAPLPLTNDAILRAAASSDASAGVPIDAGGASWILFAQPLTTQEPPTRFISIASLAPMEAAQRRIALLGAIGLAAAAALALLASIIFARGLARPVAALSGAAHSIGLGDYSVRVPVRSRDELGRLSAMFNEMAEGLALREKYRSVLDAVADPEIARQMIQGELDLGGRTQEAAVLFCDIRGFTSLTEKMPPADVIEMLNTHMTALCEVVYRHGGVVDKFVGDMIMAIFGPPRPSAEDPRRAALCALEMVSVRAMLNESTEPPIEIGIGVAFGSVVAGCMGSSRRLNFTVLGERVNLASRLCSAAGRGEVVVDESVSSRLAEVPGIEMDAMEPIAAKGFSQTVRAFKLRAAARAVVAILACSFVAGRALAQDAGAAAAGPAAGPAAGAAGAAASEPQESALEAIERGIQELKDASTIELGDGFFKASFDFWITNDLFFMSLPPPGFIQSGSHVLDAPQLSGLLTMDFADRFSVVFLGQLDRGFDPADQSAQVRADEYFGVVTPFDEPWVKLTGGKFATCFGQWVNRHFSWQNPLTNAPLMYGWETTVSDGEANVAPAPPPAAFLNRKKLPANVPGWIPIVWGPDYTSGARIGGTIEMFDYAFEVKNAPLSSRPNNWDLWNRGMEEPTYTGRIGVRPATEWNIGFSASAGPYLDTQALSRMPPGAALSPWTQRVLGGDVSYAHGPLELWAEVAASTWKTPSVGELTAYSYFIEGRWKLTPEVWLAGRWNQQLYSTMAGPAGGTAWANDVWRIDAGIGVKLDRFIIAKAQYSYADQRGPIPQGRNTVTLQLIVLF